MSWHKFRTNTAITGFGALLLSVASFTGQLMLTPKGVQPMWLSPLGVSTIILFIAGTCLIFFGIFRKRLSHSEIEEIVKERMRYLPSIKDNLALYLERAERLALESPELYDLSTYSLALQTSDKSWKWLKKIFQLLEKRDAMEALYTKIMNNYQTDNIVLAQIKQDDTKGENSLRAIKIRLESGINKIHNNRLRSYISGVYKAEHIVQSYAVFCKLSRIKFHCDPLELKVNLWKEQKIVKVLNNGVSRVNEYIDLLSKGDDFE